MKRITLFVVIIIALLITGCSKEMEKEKQEMNDMSYLQKIQK